ncbi:MAG: Flp family type IVb pilin [Rhodomicrobium sp.]
MVLNPKKLKALCRGKNGVTMLEYAFVAALIAIAAVATIQTLGINVTARFSSVASAFN